jgi:hypothetical protein
MRFAALFSHCTRPQETVATVVILGIDLRPLLTSSTEVELSIALRLAHSITVRDGLDLRRIDSPTTPRFRSRQAYRMLSPVHPPDSSSSISRALHLPSKVKLFAYLANIDRLRSRANLFSKSCARSNVCAACPSVETARHLFFDCQVSARIWSHLDVPIPAGRFSVWDLPAPSPSSWMCGAPALW